MARIKVGELAYVRMQLPDLDVAATFLQDFGLIECGSATHARYYRATDPAPYCYEVVEGPPRFLGFAFETTDRDEFLAVAKQHGTAIETIGGPGGGERIRLTEPNGYAVDLVFGREPAAAIEIPRQLMNSGVQPLLRKGELFRAKRGEIIPVKRLAHVVLGSPRVVETVAWLKDTLGLLISDEIVAGPDQHLTGAFMRLDAGESYVDHHTVFVVHSEIAGLHHISFESQDVDALLAEHHRLKVLQRYEHLWGIGRHLLGSQIFDYWCDTYGYLHEHWADTDRLNTSAAANRWDVREGMITQWGEPTPVRVRQATRP